MKTPVNLQIDQHDIRLLGAIEDGLPLCESPYSLIGEQLQMSEEDVINRLSRMQTTGIIRRFGLVLKHRQLGFRANAMVVWDVPDEEIDIVAQKIITHDFVTLCYCRARHPPVWQFNLYCMIHGRERAVVEEQIDGLKKTAGLESYPSKTLFSRRCFKQTGARFSTAGKVNGGLYEQAS
ncbi:MAG: Lrp/AsnC family transcriptional regulator [Hyphomicrobiales bacterium]|nr:Lrp/AsnC family transcriptional regulator [Hyphomicrobiales bacterium]